MSHRDRPDFGTHLSLGENRGSYVRATDRHLSLRSFRDNHSQSTLPLWDGFVNAPRRTGSASPSVPTGMAASGATPPSCATAARRQQGSQVGSCGREPPEGLIETLPFLLECAEYLVESPPRILHAPFPVEDRVAKLYPRMGAKKRTGIAFGTGLWRRAPRAEVVRTYDPGRAAPYLSRGYANLRGAAWRSRTFV